MSDQQLDSEFSFDLPKNKSSVIKVIGVGGGGSNAVNHMKNTGIKGVDFIICNTDAQALYHSPVETKIQLGVNLTEGLGAGANPEVGQQAAVENIEEIKNILGFSTKMLFITAGMGGGTGTGAAPVIAKAAKELGILTVGIVTIPFKFEGSTRQKQAEKGIDQLREHVDSLVVINNNKLREVFGNLGFKAGFAKADEVLANAAKGIAEVITQHFTTNIDLKDANTVLANSGTAIMGSGIGTGEDRSIKAIRDALDSPLLNDNQIIGAKNVLLLIVSGSDESEITLDEIGEITDYIQNEAGGDANIIMGIGEDPELGQGVAITIVATGFNQDQQVKVINKEPQKVVHPLEEDQEVTKDIFEKPLAVEEEKSAKPKATQKPIDQQMPPTDLFSQPTVEQDLQEDVEESEEEKVVFDLDENTFEWVNEPEEETEVTPQAEVEAEVETTAEQTKEVESPTMEIEEDFVFEMEEEPEIEMELPQQEVIEEDVLEEETVFEFKDEETISYSLEDFDVTDDSEESVESFEEETFEAPAAEIPSAAAPEAKPVKRYSLEDLEEFKKSLETKPVEPSEPEDETLKFEVKSQTIEPKASTKSYSDEDPFDVSIEESLLKKQAERRKRLEAFNYQFQNHQKSIAESEKVPAYKRMGIDVNADNVSKQSKMGNMTISGEDDSLDLRSNNSFLHDNVD